MVKQIKPIPTYGLKDPFPHGLKDPFPRTVLKIHLQLDFLSALFQIHIEPILKPLFQAKLFRTFLLVSFGEIIGQTSK